MVFMWEKWGFEVSFTSYRAIHGGFLLLAMLCSYLVSDTWSLLSLSRSQQGWACSYSPCGDDIQTLDCNVAFDGWNMVKFSVHSIRKRMRILGRRGKFRTRMCAGGSEICTAACPFHGLKEWKKRRKFLSRMIPMKLTGSPMRFKAFFNVRPHVINYKFTNTNPNSNDTEANAVGREKEKKFGRSTCAQFKITSKLQRSWCVDRRNSKRPTEVCFLGKFWFLSSSSKAYSLKV